MASNTSPTSLSASSLDAAPTGRSGLRAFSLAPGIILVAVIGLAAYYTASLHPSLDALALAIIFGISGRIILGKADRWLPGARLGMRVLIPAGIILYGTRLDFPRVATLSFSTIFLTLSSMLLFFIVIYWLNGLWKISPILSELIASGSAICGASAIAVLSPIADADPEDTSVSLLTITAIGILGAMLYPLLRDLLNIPDTLYAVLSGATLHQTGIVKVAVAGMDTEIVNLALAVKTTRIVMLVAIAPITGLLHTNTEKGHSPLSALKRVWFLLPFVLIGVVMSMVPATRPFFTAINPIGSIIFAMALASIGFMVEAESVMLVGSRPLWIGLIGWVCVVCVFFILSPFFL